MRFFKLFVAQNIIEKTGCFGTETFFSSLWTETFCLFYEVLCYKKLKNLILNNTKHAAILMTIYFPKLLKGKIIKL